MIDGKERCALSIIYVVFGVICFIVVCRADYDYFSRDTTALESERGYEDPHSFHYDKRTRTGTNLQEIGEWIGREEKDCCSLCKDELRECRNTLRNRPRQTDVADELFSRRLVNTLLSRVKFNQNGNLVRGLLELEATESELKVLRQFGEGLLTLRQVDPIVSDVIKMAEQNDDVSLTIWGYIYWMYATALYLLTLSMENKEVVASITFTMYMIRAFRKSQYNSWVLLSFSLTIIFILSFFISWWKLIQEAEIHHSTLQMKHAKMPVHCEPGKMSYLDTFLSWFRNTDECKEYHEARMKTPFLQVTPAQALSHMLSHVIFEPLIVSGEALSSFLRKLTADMSVFAGTCTRIAVCVSILPVIVGTFIVMSGGSVSFGNLGFLNFLSMQGPNRKKIRQSEIPQSKGERQPIEVILNINTNGQKVKYGIANALPSVESNKNETKAIEATTKMAVSSSVNAEKNNGSGDCQLSDHSSDSENDSVKTSVEANAIEYGEDGGGDRALE